MYHIGIDLGTSALKMILVDQDGKVVRTVNREYPIFFPQNGWSEQNPDDWWTACMDGMKELLFNIDTDLIKGIGCAGQMHGLVILDREERVIRPAILWNDSRTANEVEYLNEQVGVEELGKNTANMAFAGFTAPKILWLKKNEPENFAKINKIMLPKDYINYKLTGIFSTDYSDAGGTLLLDVKHKCWSDKMLEVCEINEEQLPELHESFAVIGKVKAEIADKLQLNSDTIVVAGAGDNAAAAIGTATLKNGDCNISLGTSGTIFIANDEFVENTNYSLHNFPHANGKFHMMGCMLSAASCNKWFCEEILQVKDFNLAQQKIANDNLGDNCVYFLPYLMGERSPINDTDARGTFIGLNLNTKRFEMIQAVLEGVAFAIKDNFAVAENLGITIKSSTICGGGAKSELWCKIIANVLAIDINKLVFEEGPGYGAAILAMVGSKTYDSVESCAEKFCQVAQTIKPEAELVKKYADKYSKFKLIYPELKNVFTHLKE